MFWKVLVIVMNFLPFKGTTFVHLLKVSIAPNKKQVLLLDLLINYVLARSAPKILSIKG